MKFKALLFASSLSLSFTATAFNSEEHKLIGDTGVSRVNIPEMIIKRLPSSVKMHDTDRSAYLDFIKSAKRLAVGFDGNFLSEYSKNRKGVQDNCYWTGYRQQATNKNIWIPPISVIPNRHMTLASYVSSKPSDFTFGELVAFYADYRRTIHCDDAGICHLTSANIDTIKFNRGNFSEFCPKPIAADTYLRYISSGVVPPYGSAGNVFSNSANDDEIGEAAWWGDEMLRMTVAGDNHFATSAIAHYVGLHRMALYYVNKARKEPKYWNVALHFQASALHNLTDLFAFGHDVTHRDQTSIQYLKKRKLTDHDTTRWLEHVFSIGGGVRDKAGRSSFKIPFRSIEPPQQSRNDFMSTIATLTVQGVMARHENIYHDTFNESGARVRNLNGDRFQVQGDGTFRALLKDDREVIFNAVKHSVQAMFDAYVALEKGQKFEEIAQAGSSYFKALKYIPVFIEQDKYDYFLGSWVIAAHDIARITGVEGIVPKDKCVIPYLSGSDVLWPKARLEKCMEFPVAVKS